MIKPQNPFLVSEYLSPEYFCDRQSETAELLRNLQNGWNITMVAPRRIGKTGLIKNAFYLLKGQHPEIHTYYMDVMGTQNLGDFISLLGSTVLGTLDSDFQKALKHVGDVIRSCRPTVTLDQQSGAPSFSLNLDLSQQETTLVEIFDYLKSSDKICYIAIDEFQRVSEYPERNAEALIRSQIQFLPNVKFIFAGSKRHILEQMFLDASRPFYRSTRTMELSIIPQESYYSFAAAFFQQQGRPLSQDVFSVLYSMVNGHTWYVQALLKELYSYYQPIDRNLLEIAFRALVKDNSSYYEVIYESFTPTLRRVLYALAKEGVAKETNGSAFISKYHLKAASSVSSALKTLTENDHVYRIDNGYSLYDPFFAAWLKSKI